MALRIVGAGLGRTGTSSLREALGTLLGAPCYHMSEVMERPDHVALWAAAGRGELPDWHELFTGYAAGVDWPVASFWPQLMEAFPDATVLLSVRDGASWWESASSTIFAYRQLLKDERADMIDAVLGAHFTLDLENRAVCIAAMEAHNDRVRAGVPPARLVEWRAAEGWGPLCAALGVAEPDEPFPHANSRAELRAAMGLGGAERGG